MDYFRVANWETLQHYKDRNPPWIKLHNTLLDNFHFCQLPDATKGHLILIWMLASRVDNKIPLDPKWVSQKIMCDNVDLDLLIEVGFLEIWITEQVATKDLWNSRHIPQKVKDVVWKRDKGTCRDCDTQENIEYDHKIPISKGGDSSEGNIQLLCRPCNRRKRNKLTAEQVATQKNTGAGQEIKWGNRYIPARIKEEVWARDGGACQECSSDENIEYDHIIPVSKGGESIGLNLQLLCRSCNRRKRTKTPEQVATQKNNPRSLETETETETEYIWYPDEETLIACKMSGAEVTDEMIVLFRLKILDWKDKNYTSVNLRTKFVTHCKGIQNGEGGNYSKTLEQRITDTSWAKT